jgi:competence protein ComFC
VDRALAAWVYEDAARVLVLDLKLRRDRSAAAPLVDAMRATVLQRGLAAELITWVPARRKDIRMRGFDHAEVLARGLGALLGLECRGLLRRTGAAADQTTLTAAQRWANLAGAFCARACPARVALVDDLITTGATASSCAVALRSRGALSVDAIAPCSASRD